MSDDTVPELVRLALNTSLKERLTITVSRKFTDSPERLAALQRWCDMNGIKLADKPEGDAL